MVVGFIIVFVIWYFENGGLVFVVFGMVFVFYFMVGVLIDLWLCGGFGKVLFLIVLCCLIGLLCLVIGMVFVYFGFGVSVFGIIVVSVF